MLELTKDIESLSSFKRETSRFLSRMKKTGEPMVLTIHGKAELVVQDADSYQRMREFIERVDSLEFLRKSLNDVASGQTQSMRLAVKSLGKRR